MYNDHLGVVLLSAFGMIFLFVSLDICLRKCFICLRGNMLGSLYVILYILIKVAYLVHCLRHIIVLEFSNLFLNCP